MNPWGCLMKKLVGAAGIEPATICSQNGVRHRCPDAVTVPVGTRLDICPYSR
jgi:hypothetical protein